MPNSAVIWCHLLVVGSSLNIGRDNSWVQRQQDKISDPRGVPVRCPDSEIQLGEYCQLETHSSPFSLQQQPVTFLHLHDLDLHPQAPSPPQHRALTPSAGPRGSRGGSGCKEPTCSAGDPGLTLAQENPLERGMASHSSILAWRTLWTEEPGRR
ncbi:unnamed protein product [Rangifer tarandus platyrhynchus]|uniref:Uncharacterized protein n=1 Tax=Rangifer tarandus platyrhynchus TaxID=3082113 RepID=A0ABN8YRZ9_RANTA|nr:unnamed protein product [Rangifer tarandus platyrhynchus]